LNTVDRVKSSRLLSFEEGGNRNTFQCIPQAILQAELTLQRFILARLLLPSSKRRVRNISAPHERAPIFLENPCTSRETNEAGPHETSACKDVSVKLPQAWVVHPNKSCRVPSSSSPARLVTARPSPNLVLSTLSRLRAFLFNLKHCASSPFRFGGPFPVLKAVLSCTSTHISLCKLILAHNATMERCLSGYVKLGVNTLSARKVVPAVGDSLNVLRVECWCNYKRSVGNFFSLHHFGKHGCETPLEVHTNILDVSIRTQRTFKGHGIFCRKIWHNERCNFKLLTPWLILLFFHMRPDAEARKWYAD